ncbi:MAG TPA: hypothetical protein VK524_01560 [Polyangiaceae bacterium]|nr:hypothetical protein [Polyangiaceae bacterium]
MPEPAAPLSEPLRVCTERSSSTACRSASEIEAWLQSSELSLIGAADAPRGRQGAKVLTLSVPGAAGSTVFRAKWRAYATLSALNDPRREVGAHAVQRLFLEPHEYVVPPAAGHCFALEEYRRRVDAAARQTFPGIDCVFGVLSYWLEQARSLEHAQDEGWLADHQRAFDPRWFRRSASYRSSAGDLNVLTFLIDHGDSHPAQFVIVGDSARPRLYSVDNSLSFGSFRNPKLIEDWSELLVPAVRAGAVQRLKQIKPMDLARLASIEQYAPQDGVLVHTPVREVTPAAKGLRWLHTELQLGLTAREIAGVSNKLRSVLARVRSGSLVVYQ